MSENYRYPSGRGGAKMRALGAVEQDLRDAHGVVLSDAERAQLAQMRQADFELVGLLCGRAWSSGFRAGERQPCTRPHAQPVEPPFQTCPSCNGTGKI